MEILKEILMYCLPAGALGSVITWFAKKPNRRNDFIKELQSSINLLSTEYRAQIELNTALNKTVMELKSEMESLRGENKQLLNGQEDLKRENLALKEEISSLREQLAGIKTITKTK